MSKVGRLSLQRILSQATEYRQVSPTMALLKVRYPQIGPASPDFDKLSKGKWEKIGGVDSYVATPTGDYPQNKAILFLPDAFGPQLPNNQVRSSIILVEGHAI